VILHPEQVRDHIAQLARITVARATMIDIARENGDDTLKRKWMARAAQSAHEAHDFARAHVAVHP
jgi:hypothetical protein